MVRFHKFMLQASINVIVVINWEFKHCLTTAYQLQPISGCNDTNHVVFFFWCMFCLNMEFVISTDSLWKWEAFSLICFQIELNMSVLLVAYVIFHDLLLVTRSLFKKSSEIPYGLINQLIEKAVLKVPLVNNSRICCIVLWNRLIT